MCCCYDITCVDWIISLICGLISGVISAYVVNLLRKRPKIEICKEIAKDEKKLFKIKIINKSKYDVYNFSCYVIFTEPKTGYRLVIRGNDIPFLRGCEYWDVAQTEYVSPINPMMILKEKIMQLPKEAITIKQKYIDKKLTVEDFQSEKGHIMIEFILSATNAKSGFNKLFVQKDMIITHGQWEKGENKVRKFDNNCRTTI